MKKEKFNNVVVAQSGGPSMVINASLMGVVSEVQGAGKAFGRLYGARHGIAGILARDYYTFPKLSQPRATAIALTPSSALGSCRLKPTAGDCRKIFEEFKRLKVGFFFYIGGNDSADAARIVAEEAEKDGYPLVVYHVPKTIDCDLRSCDHTPGYGSAANFVARAFMGDDLDNRALGGVKIDVVMGRDAGFLTAASALARTRPDSGPHLIYLPEVPFSPEGFVRDVQAAMKKFGRCVVAVSEGIRDAKGVSIGAQFAGGETDSHGNVQMSGTGALGDHLARLVKAKAGVKRVRADTFGYLQRSFPGVQSRTDAEEACRAGGCAVLAALAAAGGDPRVPVKGTIGILRRKAKRYAVDYRPLPIADAAKTTRSLPPEFIAKNGHDVTPAFIAWAKPLVGELPPCAFL